MIGKSVFLYGDAGTWKSTLANTGPGPRLMLDIEGRNDVLEGKFREWDMVKIDSLKGIDKDTTVVVYAPSIAEIKKAYSWLKSGKVPFKTVLLDSISQLQENHAETDFVRNGDGRQNWGRLLDTLKPPLMQFHKLAKDPESKLDCVVYVSWHSEYTYTDPETQAQEHRIEPFVKGQLSDVISHTCDLIGYTTLKRASGKTTQRMQIQNVHGITARGPGRLTKKHGIYIDNPNLAELLPEMTGRDSNV